MGEAVQTVWFPWVYIRFSRGCGEQAPLLLMASSSKSLSPQTADVWRLTPCCRWEGLISHYDKLSSVHDPCPLRRGQKHLLLSVINASKSTFLRVHWSPKSVSLSKTAPPGFRTINVIQVFSYFLWHSTPFKPVFIRAWTHGWGKSQQWFSSGLTRVRCQL